MANIGVMCSSGEYIDVATKVWQHSPTLFRIMLRFPLLLDRCPPAQCCSVPPCAPTAKNRIVLTCGDSRPFVMGVQLARKRSLAEVR